MIIVTLTLLGLCFGSFVNALVWRLHKQETARGKAAKQQYSMVHGRSMCSHCKHPLAVIDLIPVFSWLVLRGKCRYCHKPIPDTPLPELLLPLLFVLSYLFWPTAFDVAEWVNFGFWMVFLVGFMALFLYDLRWQLLPNKLVFPMLVLAVCLVLINSLFFDGGISVLTEALWGFAVGGGIFWVLFQVSDGRWIGGGDVKLGWLIGLIIGGPAASLLMIFLASLFGTVVSLPMMINGRATSRTRLPFGPFLLAATVVVYLFGQSLVSWYQSLIGIV